MMKTNKIKNIIILVIALVFSLVSVNAITNLNSCGTPVGGWISGQIYVVDINTSISKINQNGLTYCFDMINTNLNGITFNSVKPLNLVDMTMFRFDTQTTNVNINNFDVTSIISPQTNLFAQFYNSIVPASQNINLGYTFTNLKFTDNINTNKDIFNFHSTGVGTKLINFSNINIINSEINAPNLNLVSYNSPTSATFNKVISELVQHSTINNNGNYINVNKLSSQTPTSITWWCNWGYVGGNCYNTAYNGKSTFTGSNSVFNHKTISTLYSLNIANSMINQYSFNDVNLDGFADNSSIYNSDITLSLSNMRTYLELFGNTYIQDISVFNGLQNNSNRNIIDLNGWNGQGPNNYYYDYLNGIGNTISCDFVNYLNIAGPFSRLKSNNLKNCNLIFNNNIYGHNLNGLNGLIEVYGGNDIINNQFTVSNNFSLDVISNIASTMTGINIIGNTFTKTISGLNGISFIKIKPTTSTTIKNNYFGTSATGSVTYIDFQNNVLNSGQTITIENNRFTNVNQGLDKTLISNLNDIINVKFYNNFIGKNLKFNNTNIKLYGSKNYYENGTLYSFNIGNFYESNTACVDSNGDSICDSPYVFNGIVDLYPLSIFPFNYAQNILSASNTINVTTNFNVSIIQPTSLQTIVVNSNSKIYQLNYQQSSNVNVDKCNIYLNDLLVATSYNVNNQINSVNLEGLLNGNSYTTKVDCSIGNITKTSNVNVFNVIYGNVPIINNGGNTNTGGGSGGGSSNNPIQTCQDGTFKQKICSPTKTIDEFICSNGDWKATGYSCNSNCNWYDIACKLNGNNSNINQSSNNPIFNLQPIRDLFGNVTKKKICNIVLNPNTLSFNKNNQVFKFTINNNEDGSYTPNYNLVNKQGNSAIPSLSVTNSIGTINSKGSVDVGIKYKIGTFTPTSSEDYLVLSSSNCADVELKIQTSNSNSSFISSKFGGSSFGNIPKVKQLSSLLKSKNSNMDLILYGGLATLFSILNFKKTYIKGRKNIKKNRIVKGLVIALWTGFSSILILTIANLVL